MASAFALSVAKNLPSGSCTLKDGGRGVNFIAFTALNILRESSVDVISNASVSALQQARSRSHWLICLKIRHLSLRHFVLSLLSPVASIRSLRARCWADSLATNGSWV